MNAFQAAEPFPYVVFDDFIDDYAVRGINAEWPTSEEYWRSYRHPFSDKRACHHWEAFGDITRETIEKLNGAAITEMLKVFSGIDDLVADPELAGGGLHETFAGGFLKIHADFNIHPNTRLYRRLNLLLFLNQNWQEEWGGDLELWDRAKHGCQRRIIPRAGRCVIFATTDTSFHGHPGPLACPPGSSRRSIALYYYSAQPAEAQPKEHSTLYMGDEANWPQ